MPVWYAPQASLAALEEAATGMGQFMFPGRPGADAAAHAFRFEQRFAQPAGAGPMWASTIRPGQNPYASGQFQQHAAWQQQAPDWRQAYQVMGPVAGAGGWQTAGTARHGVPNKQMQQAAQRAQQAASAAIRQNPGAKAADIAAKAADMARNFAQASGQTPAQANDAAKAAGEAVQQHWETAGAAAQKQWGARQVSVNAPVMGPPLPPAGNFLEQVQRPRAAQPGLPGPRDPGFVGPPVPRGWWDEG